MRNFIESNSAPGVNLIFKLEQDLSNIRFEINCIFAGEKLHRMIKRIAVIDMGTNTFHLLIVEKGIMGYKSIHTTKEAVKIGHGGISDGLISDDAQNRAIDALIKFRKEIDINEVDSIYATATSAIRSAKNGKSLVKKIKATTGIDVRIISGDEEAELIYMGVKSSVDLGASTSMIMDIGGGSVEFIICNQSEIFWKQSFEIGAQRLLDKFHKHDPMKSVDIKDLEDYLSIELVALHEAITTFRPTTLVGASGSFDTLGEIQVIKGILNIRDELKLTANQYFELHNEIVQSNRSERLHIPGMIEMRVDMIVVACCLINYVLTLSKLKNIRISSASLKEGLLQKVLESDSKE